MIRYQKGCSFRCDDGSTSAQRAFVPFTEAFFRSRVLASDGVVKDVSECAWRAVAPRPQHRRVRGEG
jgi:hypothetical protein